VRSARGRATTGPGASSGAEGSHPAIARSLVVSTTRKSTRDVESVSDSAGTLIKKYVTAEDGAEERELST